ncbi:MAG: hypothetical protein HS123_23550 [Solibacteraceae bacterium]|nr:hypothetical protein [Solibacteraceae bacterium]
MPSETLRKTQQQNAPNRNGPPSLSSKHPPPLRFRRQHAAMSKRKTSNIALCQNLPTSHRKKHTIRFHAPNAYKYCKHANAPAAANSQRLHSPIIKPQRNLRTNNQPRLLKQYTKRKSKKKTPRKHQKHHSRKPSPPSSPAISNSTKQEKQSPNAPSEKLFNLLVHPAKHYLSKQSENKNSPHARKSLFIRKAMQRNAHAPLFKTAKHNPEIPPESHREYISRPQQ